MEKSKEATLELINRYEEILPLMHHFMQDGEVEYQYRNTNDEWQDAKTPSWDNNKHYRIKPKKVELWYEWITQKDNQYVVCVHSEFITEDLARKMFKGNETLEKTGRYFNPVTKEFGVE